MLATNNTRHTGHIAGESSTKAKWMIVIQTATAVPAPERILPHESRRRALLALGSR